MELKGVIQSYAWGKLGKTSKVALLHAANVPEFGIDDEIPYAELWMGTHCKGPSTFKNTKQELQEWIKTHKNCLGDEVVSQFGEELPFLFKVLSVNKALSVQAHPTKSHAEQLHKLHPDIYKDPNHKPELAIALTPFEALCGFRPIDEIKRHLADIPQLQTVIGKDLVSTFLKSNEPDEEKRLLKNCFQHLVSSPSNVVVEQLDSLQRKIKTEGDASALNQLLTTIHLQFPGDVGCFCIYFLNHIVLNPGESIYLGPNVPHAYLSGEQLPPPLSLLFDEYWVSGDPSDWSRMWTTSYSSSIKARKLWSHYLHGLSSLRKASTNLNQNAVWETLGSHIAK